ncbi:MAG: DUF2600 family protein [Solirubrobacteraceae bacterium]
MSSALASPLPRMGSSARRHPRARGTLIALARANARYWTSVAPVVREQLALWEARAKTIVDPRHRALALGKLRAERFNPQLAATLATQVPSSHRRAVTEAIVALQVAYDYLDALEERTPGAEPDDYASELLAIAAARFAELPNATIVADSARRVRERCERAQALAHAARGADEEELRQWAHEQANGTSLEWQEWFAGAQASVLSLHALIAAAGLAQMTSPVQAEILDRLYISIGALTMLDSLIDRDEDLAAGELGYARWYESAADMGERLGAVARDALDRSAEMLDGAHHRMTLLGVIAYYASAPLARDPEVREVFDVVRERTGRQLVPALAVMSSWRLAKSVRQMLYQTTGRRRTC